MKKFALLLIVVLVACSGGPSETVNFAGEWELDTENSDLGRRPEGQRPPGGPEGQPREGGERGTPQGRRGGFNARNISITQTENLLTINQNFMGRDGEERTTEARFNLKGKKSINESMRGERTSTAKWDKSGKVLTIKSEQSMQRGDQIFTIESTDTWTLTSDNELEIESTISTPRGERTQKLLKRVAID